MELEDTMIRAWVTWVNASGLDLTAPGWAHDPRCLLFDRLTGSDTWDNKWDYVHFSGNEEQEARIRNLADQHNGYAYAKALLAKHIADTETVVAGK